MTQLSQFIKWQFRDFGRMFKAITFTRAVVALLGAQLGCIFVALAHGYKDTLELLALTIPLTGMVFVLGLFFEMQWDRFTREQEKLLNTLKDTK